ncbi:hypothetical protein O1Q96_23620 [Streptomyces sp. Qhu-G9]|uniref:hypothetical protein n=1 Tax=Streptomyces sp. Qhu-G9 TaxID=3452799 RepID=UPI0022AC1898|nr:hypothetical protein [Streptomyces aurantiacus]WAU82468.1 hypothetical protein O1Q96_23620 [Streptomyces aurantiacus]
MEVVLASLIAVAGTLLGSIITFTFQRRSSLQGEAFARALQLRQERLTAYSAYAGTVTALKQGIVALWFLQQADADSSETRRAFTECDKLGADAENAQFRVRLLTEDAMLITLATSALHAIGPIRRAATKTELAEREQELQNALNAFVAAASVQLR